MARTAAVRPTKEKTAAQRSSTLEVRPRVKLWIEFDGEHGFCGGMYRILEAVEQTGSMKEAADVVGKSYRYVWSRVKQMERAANTSLVDAHVGGHGTRRTELTDAGRLLMKAYRDLRAEVFAASDAHGKKLKAELRQLAR